MKRQHYECPKCHRKFAPAPNTPCRKCRKRERANDRWRDLTPDEVRILNVFKGEWKGRMGGLDAMLRAAVVAGIDHMIEQIKTMIPLPEAEAMRRELIEKQFEIHSLNESAPPDPSPPFPS